MPEVEKASEITLVESEVGIDEAPGEAVEVEPRRPRRKQYQIIKVIDERRGNALIEWEEDGHVQRCFLPFELVEYAEKGQAVSIDKETLGKGAPYGEDLTPFLSVTAPTPEALQDVLRRRGIWSRQGVLDDSRTVMSVLQAVYQLDVVKLQGRVKQSLASQSGR